MTETVIADQAASDLAGSPPTHQFSDLSVEVVERILAYLPEKEIIACKRLSRWCRDVIEGSVILQYKLELFFGGFIDTATSSTSIGERLEKLREWRSAWKTLSWTNVKTEAIEVDPTLVYNFFTVYGPIYCEMQWARIALTRPASKIKDREELYLALDQLRFDPPLAFSPSGVAYDHEDEVLVIPVIDQDEVTVRIHIRSLDGEPHPLAQRPILVHRAVSTRLMSVQAFSSKIALRLTSVEINRYELLVWDWKTGTLCLHLVDHEQNETRNDVDPIAFVDANHLMIPAVRRTSEGLKYGVIAVIKLDPSLPTLEGGLEDMCQRASLILELPVQVQGSIVSCFYLSHPNAEGHAKNETEWPFRPRTGSSLVLIGADIRSSFGPHPSSKTYFRLVLPAQIIRSSLEQHYSHDRDTPPTQPSVIPWTSWASKGRAIDSVRSDEIQVYGTRCIVYSWLSGPITIYDFDTPWSIIADAHSSSFAHKSGLLLQPHELDLPSVWTRSKVTTALPCRKLPCDLTFEYPGDPILGDDYLLVRHRTMDGATDRVTLYTI